MTISNINSTLASLLSKTYSTDSSSTSSSAVIQALVEELSNSENTSSSTAVTLGSDSTAAETYNAQGLLKQMRQFESEHVSVLFDDSSNDSSNSLFDIGADDSSTASDIESMSQNWVETISKDPGKAKVMVQDSINHSLRTIFSDE